jgi:tape measure domain-containing protein
MPVLSNLIVRIGASTDDFDKQVDRALNKTKRLATTAVEAGTALAMGFSAPLIAAGAGALAAAANMESLEKGLTATMKSSSAAAAELQRLKEVSKLPGLGLQEAVQGSIRLQTLGSTANESRRIMAELGNALAIVGGGKLEFGEVIRQLSQMAAVGKVTKENLDPIVERIPQIAAIIKEKFGPAALGDPAKTFEKMGLSAQQFITIIVDELAKGDRAGQTFSNSMENLRESAFETAAEFGKSLLPVAQKVLNEFFVPGVEKAKALADAFNNLSPSTKTLALEMTALAAAVPLVIVGLATMIEKTAIVMAALLRFKSLIGVAFTALMTLGSGLSAQVIAMSGVAAGTAGATAALGLFAAAATVGAASVADLTMKLWQWYEAEKLAAGATDNLSYSTEKLLERVRAHKPEIGALEVRYRAGQMSLEDFSAAVREAAKGIETSVPQVKKKRSAMDDLIQRYRDGKITLEELTAGMKKMGELAAGKLTANLSDMQKQLEKFGVVARPYNEAMERMTTATWASEKAFAAFAKIQDELTLGNLAVMADDYSLSLAKVRFELEALGKMPPVQMAIPSQPTRKGTILEAGDILGSIGAADPVQLRRQADAAADGYERLIELRRQGVASDAQVKAAYDAWYKAEKAATGEAEKNGKIKAAAMRQVSTVITDLSRGITDVIFKGGKLSEMFANVAKQAAQSITRLLIEGALTQLANKIMNVGGLFGKVFGGAGSAATGAASSAASATASAAGGAGSAATGAAGAAVSGITGIVGAIGSIGSMVSGIIGNFQMMGMNKTLDLIEKEVRYSQIHLLNILEKGNEFWPYMKGCWESLIRMESRQMDLAANGGGGVSITINTTGDTRAILDALTRELKQLGVLPR